MIIEPDGLEPSSAWMHGPVGRALERWLGTGNDAAAVVAESELPTAAELVVVPVASPEPPEQAPAALSEGRRLDAELLKSRGFDASVGSSLLLAGGNSSSPPELLVGLGRIEEIDRQVMRRAGASAARQVAQARFVAADLRGLPSRQGARGSTAAELVQGFVEGFELASYRYDAYRLGVEGPELEARSLRRVQTSGASLERLVITCEESGAAGRGVERGLVVAAAVRLARDLVNTPAADCTPSAVAALAAELARGEGLTLEVVDAARAAAEGLGGLLGVARGSAEPPLLLRLAYEPDVDPPPGGRSRLALVGKGITFDSGGLSLKTPEGMMTMKTDMSGAAVVLAAIAACRRLGVDAAVVGFMPLTENMPGSRAMHPGDVLRMRNAKTVEVLNTDAEGRLVLADALSLAAELAPDAIVDLATLTGACVVALGRRVAGLMGNDAALIGALAEAASTAGEQVWHLPLPEVYRPLLDSEVADLKNVGPAGQAGALLAGIFLSEFAGGRPWAHLDIAGPARSEEDEGYLRKGATGFGVMTILELLEASGSLRERLAGATPRPTTASTT